MAIANAASEVFAAIGTSTTIALTTVATGAVGNLVIALITYDDAGVTLDSVQDDLANEFTKAGTTFTHTLASQKMEVWYLPNSDGGTRDITGTFSATVEVRSIQVSAWSGADTAAPYHSRNAAQGTGAAIASGNVTPSRNGALLLGFLQDDDGGATADSPATALEYDISMIPLGSAYRIQPTAAAEDISWTPSASCNWAAMTMVFLPPDPTFTLPAGQATGDQNGIPAQLRRYVA